MSNDRNEVVLNVYGVMGRQEIVRGGIVEHPILDADGSQTDITTSTGRWLVEYNGENRPVMWTRVASTSSIPNSVTPTLIPMSYDRMGRRVQSGNDTFVYDGYLNVGSTIWDPTEPIATRPLVWLSGGDTPSYYFHDGNKNVSDMACRAIRHYDYMPFGIPITIYVDDGNPWRFSSELMDVQPDFYYYNYRHYNPHVGRWMRRDPLVALASLDKMDSEYVMSLESVNEYGIVDNNIVTYVDNLGLACGSGWIEWFVPDYPGGFNFSGPCQNHDDCYGTCGKEKTECDSNFLSDMMRVCARERDSYETWCFSEYSHTYYRCTVSPKEKCQNYAKLYHLAVRKLGDDFYNDAQKASGCCGGAMIDRTTIITGLIVPIVSVLMVCGVFFAIYGVSWHWRSQTRNDVIGAYEEGVVYALLEDVFMMASDSGIRNMRGCLVPPSSARRGPSILSAPPTIESWEKKLINLDKWNGEWARSNGISDSERIIGIVRRGVHVRFAHMLKHLSVSLWYGYSRFDSPIAVIQDGEYAGWVVDIIDISKWFPERHVDSRFLEKSGEIKCPVL